MKVISRRDYRVKLTATIQALECGQYIEERSLKYDDILALIHQLQTNTRRYKLIRYINHTIIIRY